MRKRWGVTNLRQLSLVSLFSNALVVPAQAEVMIPGGSCHPAACHPTFGAGLSLGCLGTLGLDRFRGAKGSGLAWSPWWLVDAKLLGFLAHLNNPSELDLEIELGSTVGRPIHLLEERWDSELRQTILH